MSSILKISEAASLAFHAMAILVKSGKDKVSTLHIAEMLNASEHTVSKVMQSLVKAGLIKSSRGPKGGFCLTKPADGIMLSEIYESVEAPLGKPSCLLSGINCASKGCILGELVKDVHRMVSEKFSNTTLQQLADNVQLS